ncbi:MAG: NYN domain-containing protein [Clostridiales bacterium]|nr:NYN domain-containing protein [Clostridiales bacterium]
MEKQNFAIFIDLENTGGKAITLNRVIEKVKIRGDILIGKVYGYQESFSALKEVLLSNTFNVVPSLRYGVNQKNNLDIQLVIDALDVAYTNENIDCFCIVSGDSDYTPLVGKLKSMGKYVLGISRSEVASNIFIKACNEFIFLETVTTDSGKQPTNGDDATGEPEDLMEVLGKIISDQSDTEGTMFVSELKKTLLRLRPDFSEKSYGYTSFGKLLNTLENKYNSIKVFGDTNSLKVKMKVDNKAVTEEINKSNWMNVMQNHLDKLKRNGFDRVNPSIIKSELQKEYPDFDERQVGFRKFSDMLKRLEREKMVSIEFNEARTMLIKIL